MILLVNTYLHEDGTYPYERGHLPGADKLEVFKYTLASYAVLPWSEIQLRVELHPHYQPRQQELWDWVHALWGDHPKITLSFTERCTRQAHWRELTDYLRRQDDPLIWYACNHDHVFWDFGRDALQRVIQSMLESGRTDVACYYSHWPEILRATQTRGPVTQLANGVLQGTWDHMDTIQIVHKDLLWHWWHSRDYGAETYLPRSDWKDVYKTEPFTCFLPPRELARHFDGYSHLFNIAECPPLSIPPGFWEGKLRIRFGYDTPQDGWVLVNPTAPHYRAAHPEGAEIKGLLEDLPLFWKSRIAEIDLAPELDYRALQEARNGAYEAYALAHTDNWYCGGHRPDPAWLKGLHRVDFSPPGH